jgi:hypothetical protein
LADLIAWVTGGYRIETALRWNKVNTYSHVRNSILDGQPENLDIGRVLSDSAHRSAQT